MLEEKKKVNSEEISREEKKEIETKTGRGKSEADFAEGV